jgi:hypothetical protein
METCIWLPEATDYMYDKSGYVLTASHNSAATVATLLHLYNSESVSCIWRLDLIDYWDFCEFYNDRIKNVEPFYIDLILRTRRPIQHVAWFRDNTFELSSIEGRMYSANCILEVVKNG